MSVLSGNQDLTEPLHVYFSLQHTILFTAAQNPVLLMKV